MFPEKLFKLKFLYYVSNQFNIKNTSPKLTTIFNRVKDPRRDLLKLHKLNGILLNSVLGLIYGSDTWKDVETFAISEENQKLLNKR